MDIKNEVKFGKLSSFTEAFAESSVDYTLPDYLGDVRRVLFTKCEARAASLFKADDCEEVSGIVAYNVIYIDADNKLCSASFSSDYDTSVKTGTDTEVKASASPKVLSYNVRLVGPRKFSAKASVSTLLRVTSEDLIAAGGTAYGGEEKPISATRVLKIHNSLSSERVEREYAEVVERLDGSIADEVNVLYTSADVVFDGVEASDGEAVVSGTLVLSAVIQDADSPIYFVEKRVPIEERIPFEDVSADMSLIPEGTVVSLSSNVNRDEEGSEVVISAVVEYAVVGEYNEEVMVTTDAYLKKFAVENTYSDYAYSELVDSQTVSESLSSDITREEIFGDALREIVYLEAIPKIEEMSFEGAKTLIRGDMKLSGLASVNDEDGEISYTGLKFTVPFELAFKCNAVEGDSFKCNIRASCPTSTIDTDRIKLAYTVSCDVTATRARCEKILIESSSVGDERLESVAGRITVYYPDSDESLFSVAKKFHTTPEKIAEDNALSESVAASSESGGLGGVKKLFIY